MWGSENYDMYTEQGYPWRNKCFKLNNLLKEILISIDTFSWNDWVEWEDIKVYNPN